MQVLFSRQVVHTHVKKPLTLCTCKPSWPRPRPRRLCRVWKFGVIGKLLSGKEVQSSRAREKLGKALWTPLIPTRPLPPSKSFPSLLLYPSLKHRRLRLRNVFHDRKKLPKVALPSYPAAVHWARVPKNLTFFFAFFNHRCG